MAKLMLSSIGPLVLFVGILLPVAIYFREWAIVAGVVIGIGAAKLHSWLEKP